MMVVITLISILLGFYSNRVYRQRNLIAAFGGRQAAEQCMAYSYMKTYMSDSGDCIEIPSSPIDRYPSWLVQSLGEDYFLTVFFVDLSRYHKGLNRDQVIALAQVKSIRHIRFGNGQISRSDYEYIRSSLPDAKVLNSELEFSD